MKQALNAHVHFLFFYKITPVNRRQTFSDGFPKSKVVIEVVFNYLADVFHDSVYRRFD
jgi:hypothetical protein